MFSGREATHGRLAEALREYDVVHVATHAVVDSRDRVHLALTDGDAALEFSGLTPTRTASVVVLAACRTAMGPRSNGEGLINLARPFLASGVIHAVVTLTDVPDEGTAVLMGEFHSQLSHGVRPAEALAMAQRARVRDSGKSFPWWSAFVLVSAR
jgi:CHAT domain-containing protein